MRNRRPGSEASRGLEEFCSEVEKFRVQGIRSIMQVGGFQFDEVVLHSQGAVTEIWR